MYTPLITNDAVVLGILFAILAFVFGTSSSNHPFWKKFYKYVPSLLLCYFLPSIFNSLGIISGEQSGLYKVASRYLLPSSLVLLCISIDMKGIMRLGPKAVIMFLAGTIGIILGGPLAIFVTKAIAPSILEGSGADEIWRGMATIAGSWIGGGANQTAMKEVFQPSDKLFSMMIAVDVIVANIWMAFLLYGAGIASKVDAWLKADSSSIEEVKNRIENYQLSVSKIPSLTNMIIVLSVGFIATGISHLGADMITPYIKEHAPYLEKFSFTSDFFWIVIIATTLGLALSFNTRIRALEGVGASKVGSVLLYVLVATIGMKMDITAVGSNPGLFLIGIIWMIFHVIIMLIVAKIIKAPLFFLAVGSQANVGGAASAPIVASAFHPSLAAVGVLLAVFGYALGTYGAWICGQLMSLI